MIALDRLKRLVEYDPVAGDFRWLVTRSNAKIGAVAGCIHVHPRGGRKYRYIHIDGRNYLAHRLAWYYVRGEWPSKDLDHIDGDGLNNAIANLREATASENMRNRKLNKNNLCGLKGVSWSKRDQKWRAQIKINGSTKHLGLFADAKDAHAAYAKVAQNLFGEFARVE